MSAAKKRRAGVEESDDLVERAIARDKPRSLDDVVTALAQAGTDAAVIRKTVEPILFAFIVGRGEAYIDWAATCEWRGSTLRFVIYGANGEEFDPREIPVLRARGARRCGVSVDRLVTLRGARGRRVARIAPPSGWGMAAFLYRDGRRELRRVPIPPCEVLRVVANFGAVRPVVLDMRAYPPVGMQPRATLFRLRRGRPGSRLIYDEIA